MITKKDIEAIKDEIFAFAKKHDLGKDFSVFCNNNLYHYKLDENYEYKYEEVKDVNPLDYSEYFPEEFLIGLAYDGIFYEFMNEVNPWMVKADEEFMELLKSMECGLSIVIHAMQQFITMEMKKWNIQIIREKKSNI